MGTQGLRIRLTDARNVACGSSTVVALIATSLVLATALAGCSSFSSPTSSSAQTSAAPPPQYSAAPTPPVADDAAASAYPYPKQSLVEVFKDTSDSPPAQNVPRPPSTYTPAGQPYQANPPYGAAASAPPPQPTPPADAQAVPGYPQQSLTDLFSSK